MEKISPISVDVENQHLSKNSLKAIAGTLLSRFSGIIRTLIVNATFGANTSLDAFNASFRFPNSLRDLFADGALSAAFIKVLVDVSSGGDEAIRELIAVTTGFFLTVTVLLALLGVIYANSLMSLVGGHAFALRGGLSLAVVMFQILVFYLPVTMLNAIAMGVLGFKGDMFRAMNGSLFLSVGMIIGALILGPLCTHFNYAMILGLAIGAMVGVLLQLIYQAYPLKRWKLLVAPSVNIFRWWRYKPLHNMLLLMVPRALGQGALVFALLVNTYFAIQVGKGALTYVATTVIIIQVPIGLFGVSTGFAALPLLSAAYNEFNSSQFFQTFKQSLVVADWMSLFTIACFALLIVPFYSVFFQYGHITYYDTLQNSLTICAYGIGIFFACRSKILLNVLYAINATRQIVINSLIYLCVNISLSALLAPRLGLLGLGLSFATATALDCWIYYCVVMHKVERQFSFNEEIKRKFSTATISFIMLSLFSYLLGLSGVVLCKYFWPNFALITHRPFDKINALIILIVGGILVTTVFIALCRKYGPPQLQRLINKWVVFA